MIKLWKRLNGNHEHQWSLPYFLEGGAQSEWLCLHCGTHRRTRVI